MITEQTIIIINAACISVLAFMTIILVIATRLKGGAGYAALIVVSTTLPVYIANTMRSVGIHDMQILWHIATLVNTLCFPLTWLFVHSQLDKSYRFSPDKWLHFIPSLISLSVSLIYYYPKSPEEFAAEMEYLETNKENLPAIINDIIVFGQFFIYFTLMFRFLRRTRQNLQENYSDSDYLTTRWISIFITLFFILFFIVFVAYVISPRTDAWLIPILNVIGMSYLIYNSIAHPTEAYLQRIKEMTVECISGNETTPTGLSSFTLEEEQQKEICEQVVSWLTSTKAYLKSDLSLAMLSKETGIPQKNISRSINEYLKCNFFELINKMRIEEAKRRLLMPEASGYKIDSIYEQCGFRTRSTFFLAFKKAEGKSPAQWLKSTPKTE
ncbi:helix-turn-helix domain-containing protein [Parabacteroides gordonii]|uniref:helix-turn-helix domain-containing protein n=1 Tax=Parabacteroides gordonii TaxID=574930 RepID=UPI0026EFFBE8|nr:helix-turn-helix domain-containing protein [Parabacteroides gordonii]